MSVSHRKQERFSFRNIRADKTSVGRAEAVTGWNFFLLSRGNKKQGHQLRWKIQKEA